MRRREFLQDLSAVGASTFLPRHACARASLPASQTQRPSEEVPAGSVAVVAIGGDGVEVLSALSGKLSYLKRSIAISTDPVVLLRAAASEKLMFGPHAVSQFSKGFRRDFEYAIDGIDIVFVVLGSGDSADTGPAEAITGVLRVKSIPVIAAVMPSVWNEDEHPDDLMSADFHALKAVSNAVFPLATASRLPARSPYTRKSALNRAADAFQCLYHGVVKPVFGHGFITWDLEDVVSTLPQEGASAFGCGMASGEHAIETATLRAISSDSLGRRRLFSASAIFAHLEGRIDLLKFNTVATMMDIVRRVTDEHYDSLLISGATEDNMPSKGCRVTILASGIHAQ